MFSKKAKLLNPCSYLLFAVLLTSSHTLATPQASCATAVARHTKNVETTEASPLSIAVEQFKNLRKFIPEISGPANQTHSQKILEPESVLEGEVIWPEGFPRAGQRVYWARSMHNSVRGTTRGGWRWDEEVDRGESIALSMGMTRKTALAGIPFGGAKGGVAVDPKSLSAKELEFLTRNVENQYIAQLTDLFGSQMKTGLVRSLVDIDSGAPDVGSNAEIMHWKIDQFIKTQVETEQIVDKEMQRQLAKFLEEEAPYSKEKKTYGDGKLPLLNKYMEILKAHPEMKATELSWVTGKSPNYGGALGRAEATGYGVFVTAREYAKHFMKSSKAHPLSGKSFALQGFGNVGYWAAHFIHQSGGKVTRIVEWNRNPDPQKSFELIEDPGGIDISELAQFQKENGSITDFVSKKTTTSNRKVDSKQALKAFVSSATDFIIPAAMGGQITSDNAHLVRSVVLEAANGPVTPEADKVVSSVVPDALTNQGGVIASGIEYGQNMDTPLKDYATRDEVLSQVDQIMVRSFAKVLREFRRRQGQLSLRLIAGIVSIKEIVAPEKETEKEAP